MNKDSSVGVFAVLDFVLAGLSFLGVLAMVLGLFYGVFLSGDKGSELATGVLGCALIMLPFLASGVAAFLGGLGLLKRARWGYYAHIVASILAALSCLGIVYTVISLVFAFKPEFKAEFFGPPA
jgi:hypothetical protein